MKILSHGLPFFCAYDTLKQYRGKHEIRSLSAQPLADYRLRPEADTLEDVLARMAPEFVPDLILVWTPENDPPPLGIEHSPVPTACLAGDWNLFHSAQEYNFGRYDVVLADRPGTALLRNDFVKPTYWGPLYAQNTLLHRERPCTRDIDILYIGNLNLSHRGERGKWLQRLAQMPPQWNVLLTTDVWRDEYTQLLSRAKIVFNHSVRGELNLRVFESMACGALAFFEEYNQEVKDYFTDGVDIVLYNDENFEERLTYYLEHPEEAAAIARRGQVRAQEFSGEARFDALIDYIFAQPRSGRPFLRLDEKERALNDFLMVTVSQRPEYGPIERRLGQELPQRFPDAPRAWSAFARSIMYYRDFPPNAGQVAACIDAHRKALGMAPNSAIHAMNGAATARAIGNDKAEEIFLTIALKATTMEPSGYLWGTWQEPFWTGWLRSRAEKKISLEKVHAEAHACLAKLHQKREDGAGALRHLDAALALTPENSIYIEARAELLWELGHEQDALIIFFEALAEHPLDVQYRITLAERCMRLGIGEPAKTCVVEAEAICARLRVPYRPPLGPQSHAATRELAAESPLLLQEARLRARAAEGDASGLLWFLATLGRIDDARAVSVPKDAQQAQAVKALLTEPEIETTRGLALLEGQADPALYHALLKHRLRAGDLDGAWSVVKAALAAAPGDVACVNLFARVASVYSDARLEEAITRSLTIAPKQQDIEALRNEPFVSEIHLGPAPKRVPITFYLPAFNVERYIRDTMEHVFLQDYPIAEFVIVNDGTQDASMAIAREFPVTILHHDANRGLAAARNTALLEAKGVWLLSTDTDARPEPDYVRQIMTELETRDPSIAAIGGVLIEAFQEEVPDKWRARMMAQHHGPARQCPPWFLYGSTMCIERAAAIAAGGYDEAHRTNGEDTELCKALQMAGRRLLYSPRPRAHHLRRDDLNSVLKTWWNWHYWVKIEANAWRIIGGLVHAMLHNFGQAANSLQRFMDSGERDLWYITFLFLFYDVLADFAQAVKTGLISPGEAARLHALVLQRAHTLDARFGGKLAHAIARDTEHLGAPWAGAAAAELSPGFQLEFNRYLTNLDDFLDSVPEALYQGIEEGAAEFE